MKIRKLALCAAATWLAIGLASASAQGFGAMPPQDEAKLRVEHPELYVLPPVPHTYKPKRTSWGDPDLRGMWPIDSIGGLVLQRTPAEGKRVWLTDEEYKAVSARMEKSREAPREGDQGQQARHGQLGRDDRLRPPHLAAGRSG